jgi:succinyl-CoA synthetase alpha subunit
MAILIDENTRMLIQGITGRFGQGVARRMIEVGSKVVVGVTPGRGGQSVWRRSARSTPPSLWCRVLKQRGR